MLEISGDFWREFHSKHYDAIVCTINQTIKKDNHLVMGKGIALEFRERYPNLSQEWGSRIKSGKTKIPLVVNSRFMVDISEYMTGAVIDVFLVGLPTKIHWKDPSKEEFVVSNCKKLRYLTDMMGWTNVLMTKPGCGNGGLTWDSLKLKLNFLDDRFKVMETKV